MILGKFDDDFACIKIKMRDLIFFSSIVEMSRLAVGKYDDNDFTIFDIRPKRAG